MDVKTAYRVVKSLELSAAQEKRLADLLKTGGASEQRNRRRPVMTVARAERIFTRLIRNKGS